MIELMVVVAVTAILAAIATPSFRSLLAEQRLSGASSSINSALWLARSEAIKRNTTVILDIASTPPWSVYRCTDGSNGCTGATREALAVIDSEYGSITLPNRQFTFNNQGRLTTGIGEFQITHTAGTYQRCISVTTSGKSSSRKGACS